jgi:hypothetical protein
MKKKSFIRLTPGWSPCWGECRAWQSARHQLEFLEIFEMDKFSSKFCLQFQKSFHHFFYPNDSNSIQTWTLDQGILKGKYHCTVDLMFDWFGISCMTTDNFCFYFQNRLIQTSQTGGQQYSDSSPFSIPCLDFSVCFQFKSHSDWIS